LADRIFDWAQGLGPFIFRRRPIMKNVPPSLSAVLSPNKMLLFCPWAMKKTVIPLASAEETYPAVAANSLGKPLACRPQKWFYPPD